MSSAVVSAAASSSPISPCSSLPTEKNSTSTPSPFFKTLKLRDLSSRTKRGICSFDPVGARYIVPSFSRRHPTVLSNGAGRRLCFHVCSCKRVGLRGEKSLLVFSLRTRSDPPQGAASLRFSGCGFRLRSMRACRSPKPHSNQLFVAFTVADPEPQKSPSPSQSQCPIVQRDPRRPHFLAAGFSNFLEL